MFLLFVVFVAWFAGFLAGGFVYRAFVARYDYPLLLMAYWVLVAFGAVALAFVLVCLNGWQNLPGVH